jgi:hypothetical protein
MNTDFSTLVAGDPPSLISQIVAFQKTFRKCTWCKDPYQWRKNNYCENCGHDLNIDWNTRRGIYKDGYIDKEGYY